MVAFSGLTVAVSLISLCVFPQRFLYSIGLGGGLVALASAAVCLLFLPALLAVLGHRVNALAPRRFQGPPREGRWMYLARFVLRYPMGVAVAAVALMLAASLPFLRVELTRASASVLPTEASARQVADTIDVRFASDPADQIVSVVPASNPRGREGSSVRSPRIRWWARSGALAAGTGLAGGGRATHRRPFSDAAVDAVERARAVQPGAATSRAPQPS
jgi:RND superfamily putative drug exporter